MKKKTISAAIAIIAIGLTSCQKESGTPPTETTNTSVLQKYIEVDTSGAQPDTSFVYTYSYDNAGRNSAIDAFFYEAGKPTAERFSTKAYYNGSDSLPFRVTINSPLLSENEPGYINSEFYLQYKNGTLASDSLLRRHADGSLKKMMARHYTYRTGLISIDIHYTLFDPQNGNSEDWRTDSIQLTANKNNITSVQSASNDYLHELTYDSHANPFYKTLTMLATMDDYFPYYAGLEVRNTEAAGVNNLVESNFTNNGGLVNYHFYYKYEYNTNGKPSKIRYTSQGNLHYPIIGYFIYKQ